MMRAVKIARALIAFLVNLPCWYFILYTILKSINVDRLVWFLFWMYVPAGLLTSFLGAVVEGFAKLEEK